MAEVPRKVVDVLAQIIDVIPEENKEALSSLRARRNSYKASLWYAAPEIVDLKNQQFFQELCIYLPTLSVNKEVLEKIKNIFENKN